MKYKEKLKPINYILDNLITLYMSNKIDIIKSSSDIKTIFNNDLKIRINIVNGYMTLFASGWVIDTKLLNSRFNELLNNLELIKNIQINNEINRINYYIDSHD